MSMRNAATRKRGALAVVQDDTPATPAEDHDGRLLDSLAYLRYHVIIWRERELLPQLDIYNAHAAARDGKANLAQYKEFKGAVASAAVVLRGPQPKLPPEPEPEPEYKGRPPVKEMWRCPECRWLFNEKCKHDCPPIPPSLMAPSTTPEQAHEEQAGHGWRLVSRENRPDTTPGLRSPVAQGWDGEPAPSDPPGPVPDPDRPARPGALPEDDETDPAYDCAEGESS